MLGDVPPRVKSMPRRRTPDPLALAIGQRIRELREEQGLTAEKLAYESELGSKGFLSDIEKGLARPTVQTLAVLAERLGVELFDLLVFPGEGPRHKLVDLTRGLRPGTVRRLTREMDGTTAKKVCRQKASER